MNKFTRQVEMILCPSTMSSPDIEVNKLSKSDMHYLYDHLT